MAVSKRLRHEVMRRDNHTCRYCGGAAPDVKLTIDHVTPTTLGGADVPSNLVTACADCNAGKSATPPDAALVADVDQRAVEWGQAMQVAIEQRAAELAAIRTTADPFDAAWSRWSVGSGGVVPRDANWRGSIQRFLAAGLSDQFLADSVNKAMGQDRVPTPDKWKYFCGICWREMDTLQKMAREIASEREASTPAAMAAALFVERDPFDKVEFYAGEDDVDPSSRYSEGMHPEFPVIALAERFAKDLAAALGAPIEVMPQIEFGIWDAMRVGYLAFLEGPIDGAGLAEPRTEKAFVAFTDGLMFRIKLAHESWSQV